MTSSTSTALPTPGAGKDGVIHCTGKPVGVARTRKPVVNFELLAASALAFPRGRELGEFSSGPRRAH